MMKHDESNKVQSWKFQKRIILDRLSKDTFNGVARSRNSIATVLQPIFIVILLIQVDYFLVGFDILRCVGNSSWKRIEFSSSAIVTMTRFGWKFTDKESTLFLVSQARDLIVICPV